MKQKFKRLDEVSFSIKGQKVYGIVKDSQPTTIDGKPTFRTEILLIPQLILDGKVIKEIDVLTQDDLAPEKFPIEVARLSHLEIK